MEIMLGFWRDLEPFASAGTRRSGRVFPHLGQQASTLGPLSKFGTQLCLTDDGIYAHVDLSCSGDGFGRAFCHFVEGVWHSRESFISGSRLAAFSYVADK